MKMLLACCLLALSGCTTVRTVHKMPEPPAVLMQEPIKPIVAEEKLNGSNDLSEFLGVVVENNRIALKNLNQLKELQGWIKESLKVYK